MKTVILLLAIALSSLCFYGNVAAVECEEGYYPCTIGGVETCCEAENDSTGVRGSLDNFYLAVDECDDSYRGYGFRCEEKCEERTSSAKSDCHYDYDTKEERKACEQRADDREDKCLDRCAQKCKRRG